MLNDELLFFHRASLGHIATMHVFDWIHANDTDSKKMWDTMVLLKSLIEKTNPNQADIQEVIDWGMFTGMDEHLELFETYPFIQALQKLLEFPEKEWGLNCYMLFTFFYRIDNKKYKIFCRNGCEHEWHNLNKLIRTEDLLGVMGFYTSIGMKFVHNVRHNGEHYQGHIGQSELLIYRVTPSSRKYAGLKFHLRFRVPNFNEVVDSLKKREIPVTIGLAENGLYLMAELNDPDGRKLTLYDSM